MKNQSKTKQTRSESGRRKVERALKESEESGWTILENIQEGYYEVDLAGNYTFFNSSMSKILGYTKEEMMGINYRLYMDKETAKKIFRDFNEVYRTGIPSKVDYEQIKKDGSKMYVETSVALMRDSFGQPTGFRGIVRDITDRKRAEVKLRQQTDAMEAAIDGMALINEEGEYVYLNKAHARVYGYENTGELIGKSWRILYDSDVLQRFEQEIMPEFSRKGDWHGEAIGTKKNGSKFPQELSLTAMANGGLICVVRDITERKKVEEQLRESEEKFRNILENIEDGYFEVDRTGNFTFFNPSLCRIVGYPREEIPGMNNRIFMDANNAKKVFQAFNEVYVTGIPKKGFEWETIRKDGARTCIEVSVSLIARPGEKPTGFRGIARDVTERKRTEEKLQRTLESLRKAFGATIQVMVSAVETRDPYTAGHQTRSADLARAIAIEMGLPQDKIDGLRMAGVIHDIGKLSIPAEILSKPTKLSEIEFALIKEHARQGYEILKGVESPWPLAEIVYQHHERMNGSGYPRKLKGDGILIEARILTVADVVEAMASHRPYRPGLGIDAALNEIEKNRGIFYDDTVADACLRLFRVKGFQLATP